MNCVLDLLSEQTTILDITVVYVKLSLTLMCNELVGLTHRLSVEQDHSSTSHSQDVDVQRIHIVCYHDLSHTLSRSASTSKPHVSHVVVRI